MGIEVQKLSIAEWISVTQNKDVTIPITLHTTSGSMLPTIRMNEDTVVVIPCKAADVRVGDVVLVKKPDTSAGVLLHRLYRIGDGKLVTLGDNMRQPDQEVNADALLGRAVSITGPGKNIDCDDPKWRKHAARWVALWRLRPLLMLPHRVVDKVERTVKKQDKTWKHRI